MSDHAGREVVVVIPAHDEAATVGDVVQAVRDHGMPVVVVDDGSTDETGELALRAGATVLRLPINLGVGAALRCGFRYAAERGYEIAVQCDADGQHDPASVQALVQAMRDEHAHLVIGNRFGTSDSFDIPGPRRFVMRILARVASRSAGTRIDDATSGFRAVRTPLLQEFADRYPAQYLGDTFEVLVASARAGYRVVSTPALIRERQGGVRSAGTAASLAFLVRALLVVVLRIGTRYRPAPIADKRLGV
ncbi:MAG: glycosyltransferase family 2 protein [Actinobacteria bacterium]|nr:glycosyltransferase family 2 protein [Actinomycetota bacterium]